MKRTSYIILAMTFAVAAACTKSEIAPVPEIQDSQRSYIFFEPGVLNITETKATLIDGQLPADDKTAFGVIGYYEDDESIFTDYDGGIAHVYRDGEGVFFKYDHLQPWLGSTHTFYAFYPYDELLDCIKFNESTPYIEYIQPTSADNMKDIMATTMKTNKVEAVKLTFDHLLWAFRIKIQNSQTTEFNPEKTENNEPSITITEIVLKIADFPKKNSLQFSGTHPGEATEKSDFTYTVYSSESGKTISANATESFEPLLFIPTNLFKYNITVKYKTPFWSDEVFTYVYPSENGYKESSTSSFIKGKVYSITIKKTNDMFFIGDMENEGNWVDVQVDHTFN